MSIFIMLNNFFHDFAVALLFVSLLILSYIYKQTLAHQNLPKLLFTEQLYAFMRKLIWAAWFWIIVGGVIRTLAYEQYEWNPAVGRGQVAALILKHIFLITLVIWGSIIQFRLKKRMHQINV